MSGDANNFNEFNDGGFWPDQTPADSLSWLLGPFEFEPKYDSILIFNVETGIVDIQLANVMLSRLGNVDAAVQVLKAAWAMREVLGHGPLHGSEDARRWNTAFSVGQTVSVHPGGMNGEGSFLSRTDSPAFETASGACILLENSEKAFSLLNVRPSALNLEALR